MIVGIDTYRDSQNRSAQMIGFVASINPTCTRYYSRVIEQRTHHDLISGLKQSMQGKCFLLSCTTSALSVRFSCYTKISSVQWYFTSEDYCLP